jgi:hypothetical protein
MRDTKRDNVNWGKYRQLKASNGCLTSLEKRHLAILKSRAGQKKRSTSASLGCEGEAMSWDAPDRCWRFAIDDDPPADLPAAWATATRAVTRDLDCRRHGRPITFANVMWRFVVSDEWVARVSRRWVTPTSALISAA